MKYTLIAILMLFPVIAFSACGDDDDDGGTVTQTTTAASSTASPTATPTTGLTTTASPTATASAAADVCPENPDPATDEQAVIEVPLPGDRSSTPLTVAGQVAVFEAQFNVSILDADGNAIVDNFAAHSAEGQTLAPFEVDVPFTVTEETPACLQVYDISNADGLTHENIAQVPVTLLP